MKITHKIATAVAVVALTAGAATSVSSNTAVPAAISPQVAVDATPVATLTKQKVKLTKTTRAKYTVKIKRTKGMKIKSVQAWVGDRADGGVQAKVRNIKDTKKHWRWQVVVPMTATEVAKKGLTTSYMIQKKDGTQQWRDIGVTLGVR